MRTEINRQFTGKGPTFHQAKKSGFSVYRLTIWVGLILAALWVLTGLERGRIISPYMPTPTPTRTADSYIREAEAYFQAGKLYDPDPPEPAAPRYDAIDTYQRALQVELQERGLKAEIEFPIQVRYKNTAGGDYRADLFVAECVVVELKIAKCLNPDDEAQLINELKATDAKVGLLINFGRAKVEFVRRVFCVHSPLSVFDPCPSVASPLCGN